jgi:flagellar basal-body rod protein FlgF
MGDGLYAAMSGAVARSMALDVVANNVSNAPTPGFRADMAVFREVPAQPAGEPPRVDTDLRLTTLDAVVPTWQPGPITETGSSFDLAIEGQGMLAVQTNNGLRYARGGSMAVDQEGVLRTSGGNALVDTEGRPIRIPLQGGEPLIGEDGTITAGEQTVGRLNMVWFDNPEALQREGDNLFSAPGGVQIIEPQGALRQGFIEGANVNVVRGMIDLVSLTRSYEATIRAMESFQNIDRRTARDLGRG